MAALDPLVMKDLLDLLDQLVTQELLEPLDCLVQLVQMDRLVPEVPLEN